MKVVALIDGEHHPDVAREALERLASDHDVRAVVFVGGEEKVGGAVLDETERHYGRRVTAGAHDPPGALRDVIRESAAEAVFDLSGEPVVGGDERFRLASVALHLGLEYRAPGMRLRPPPEERLATDRPVVAVVGTGKRAGKTAVACHWARLLRQGGLRPVVVAMGRGGPPEPQVVPAGEQPDLDALLRLARGGSHAASDYLEDAVLAGVASVGCRRCGEGPAGEPFDSNVAEGARIALGLEPDVVLLEGSGAALPPIAADRTVCVTTAARARREALSHLGPYRLLRSDLVLITGAASVSPQELELLKEEIGAWNAAARIIGCRLEPEPAGPVREGARAALFTTAPASAQAEIRSAIERHGVEVAVFSSSLARRAELERDVERALAERCELFLTELKAAAVEIVADRAARAGIEVVFVRNRPVALENQPDLDAELGRLAVEAGGAGAERGAAVKHRVDDRREVTL